MNIFLLFVVLHVSTSSAQRIESSECTTFGDGTIQLVFVLDFPRDFDGAEESCRSLTGGSLARIDSLSVFNFAIDTFNAFVISASEEFWIGVEAIDDPLLFSTDRFQFSDGSGADTTFFSNFGELPWESDKPSESQDCVEWEVVSETGLLELWDDSNCSFTKNFICRVDDCDLAIDIDPQPSDGLVVADVASLGLISIASIFSVFAVWRIRREIQLISLYSEHLDQRKEIDLYNF